MKDLKQGTAGFGAIVGLLFMLIGILWMSFGFWKMLILLALFAVGYFLGAVNNKEQFVKDTVNRVIPEKKNEPIHVREELKNEQAQIYSEVESEIEEEENDNED